MVSNVTQSVGCGKSVYPPWYDDDARVDETPGPYEGS